MLRHSTVRTARSRTAGWGYLEPYTRDLMLSAPGILVSGDPDLVLALRRVLEALAENQSPLGHIPGLANDPRDRGSSDTTPLFLIGLALYRQHSGEAAFLQDAADRALRWLAYQSPDDRVMIAQQPTSDWRDEQWVLGYGLYANTLLYAALTLFGEDARASLLRERINQGAIVDERKPAHVLEGLALPDRPHYALWSYKVHHSVRFDLMGNCLAMLFGVAAPEKAQAIVAWIEDECTALRASGMLRGDVPPCLIPVIQREDPDWHPRYERYNRPGNYHNGGVWPFIGGWYVAALVASGEQTLAQRQLAALAELARPARRAGWRSASTSGFRRRTAPRAARTGRRGPAPCCSTPRRVSGRVPPRSWSCCGSARARRKADAMDWRESGDMRLGIRHAEGQDRALVTSVRHGSGWEPASTAGFRAMDSLKPAEAGTDYLAGALPGLQWRTQIVPEAGGFWLDTVLRVEHRLDLNPAMILWLGTLDHLNDRQAHTWRQTILRAPTVNQGGLPGNDLAAGYLYDHATLTESICYFPGDAFLWAPWRFYNFTVREVAVYRPTGKYGLGLLPNAPDVLFTLEPGEHRFRWWFAQRRRTTIPSPWEAPRTLIDTLAPLLDPAPSVHPEAIPAGHGRAHADDLRHNACCDGRITPVCARMCVEARRWGAMNSAASS